MSIISRFSNLEHFASIKELIQGSEGERPIHCLRPALLESAAAAFLEGFPGDTMFAVKCNAHPTVLRTLTNAGLHHFDVASEPEIDAAYHACPKGVLYFHHPAKTARAIRNAFEWYGVRHFVVDFPGELTKVLSNTGVDAKITVRISVPQDHAVYDLSTKFGTTIVGATALLRAAVDAGRKVGVSFHVGSQCLSPEAYAKGMAMAVEAAEAAGVHLDYLNVGGGFPGYYATTDCPPLSAYFQRIAEAGESLGLQDTRLMCEPGRALVYQAGSLLTRVILRKDDSIYINDGIFGGFAEVYWGGDALTLRHRVHRDTPTEGVATKPFLIYGPTCDGNDKLPYSVNLPEDIQDGDWIEFYQLGAYGREMSTAYNGLGSNQMVIINSADPFV